MKGHVCSKRRIIWKMKKQNTELEKDINNLKLAQAFLGTSASKEEAKERIAKMVKSIDKCISLMEK